MKPDSKFSTGTENTMAEEICKIRSDCASRKSVVQIGTQKKPVCKNGKRRPAED